MVEWASTEPALKRCSMAGRCTQLSRQSKDHKHAESQGKEKPRVKGSRATTCAAGTLAALTVITMADSYCLILWGVISFHPHHELQEVSAILIPIGQMTK